LEKRPANGCPLGSYEIILLKQRESLCQEKESISVVKEREREGTQVHSRTIEEIVY